MGKKNKKNKNKIETNKDSITVEDYKQANNYEITPSEENNLIPDSDTVHTIHPPPSTQRKEFYKPKDLYPIFNKYSPSSTASENLESQQLVKLGSLWAPKSTNGTKRIIKIVDYIIVAECSTKYCKADTCQQCYTEHASKFNLLGLKNTQEKIQRSYNHPVKISYLTDQKKVISDNQLHENYRPMSMIKFDEEE